ncbi:glucose-6-phosphate dehydrogenase [Litorihabitans aurantiacus]|uniref:Glucose-6-phosphate 1-dehydrogenase n=1 Tax=Litorihabitans aurantiacus TaxID=1930061 RepID=A0AA38CWL2_9MICO|nr:glucose-6-phosphate dehydrogenase [Litorihabitans aurantiacus]GMA33237.1 glucose-6-phosphate 1-dehydrogenase [Litorihabitans aurantiacus]
MSVRTRSDRPATLVILGASGDLTRRLLLPGIGSLLAHEPDRDVRVIGADRDSRPDGDFEAEVRAALTEGGAGATCVDRVAGSSSYVSLDATDHGALTDLLRAAAAPAPGSEAAEHDGERRVVLYFALPPAVTAKVCGALCDVDLPAELHLAMEKPFGQDEDGARALNALVAQLVPDDQVHRVDHFLGMTTVLDLIALRFANRMFQAVWTGEHVAGIEIAYDEQIALEGRAGYYDHAGALRDMIQSHLLQVMALATMEPPASITERDLRDAQAAALRATRLWGGSAVGASRRARYTAGRVEGVDDGGRAVSRSVPSYVDEDGVDPARGTETLAQITVEVANSRWAGVPITLRSGKALGGANKHVALTFAPVRHLPGGLTGADPEDRLVIGLNPDTMELRVTTNSLDDPLALGQSVLRADLRRASLAPYGEVLAGILDGDGMLTVRGDAAEECWRICDEVLAAWDADEVPMEEYPAGSAVPEGWGAALG